MTNLIFDWSGTLCDSFSVFCQVVDKMMDHFGKDRITEEEIRKHYTIPYMKFWNKLIPNLTHEDQNKAFGSFIKEIENPDIYPGVKKTLNKLHKNKIRLFVVSSDPQKRILLEMKKGKLNVLFEDLISDIHEKHIAIESLVKRYKLKPDETFYVGDSSGDVEEGKKAGIKTIGISWGFQDKIILESSQPTHLIDNIVELEGIFLK